MKGQNSMEFLAYISFSMLILAVLYGVIAEKQTDSVNYAVDSTASQVADRFAFETEMALVQGDGYSHVFSVPEGIGGYNYTVKIGRGNVLLLYDDERLLRSTRYSGEWINVTVDDDNVLRVVNDGGVRIEE